MGKAVPKIGSGNAERFDQKNIMFRRVLWDESVQKESGEWYKPLKLDNDRVGYTLKEWSLQCASWFAERWAARGNQLGNYGLLQWDVDPNDPKSVLHLEGYFELTVDYDGVIIIEDHQDPGRISVNRYWPAWTRYAANSAMTPVQRLSVS